MCAAAFTRPTMLPKVVASCPPRLSTYLLWPRLCNHFVTSVSFATPTLFIAGVACIK